MTTAIHNHSTALTRMLILSLSFVVSQSGAQSQDSSRGFRSLLNPVNKCSCCLCTNIFKKDNSCDCDECSEPTCGTDGPCCDEPTCDGCGQASKSKGGCGLLSKLGEMFSSRKKKEKTCQCGQCCNQGNANTHAHGHQHSQSAASPSDYHGGTAPAPPMPIEVSPVVPGATSPGNVVPVPAPVPQQQFERPALPRPETDSQNDPFRDDNVRVRRKPVPRKALIQASYSEEVGSGRPEATKYRQVSLQQVATERAGWSPVHVKVFKKN